jgi:hypothetical protein
VRRVLVITVVAVLAMTAVGSTGCARNTATGPTSAGEAPAGEGPAGEPAAGVPAAGAKEAEVYVQVLRRYISTPAENSFPGQTFKTVYVLDQAHPDAANPLETHRGGTPIASTIQRHITDELAGITHIAFIANRDSVIETRDGCPQVKGGGILITLGTVDGDDTEVQVGFSGFVACLGGTWLTYVVRNQPGTGWRVTGTTGSMGIA